MLELDARGARFGTPEHAGMIFVDGVDIGDVADAALRDRRMLSADGIFIVVATISEQDGKSVADPEVIFRGVPFLDEAGQLREEIQDLVETSLESAAKDGVREPSDLQQLLHDHLAALIWERLEAPADGAAGGRRSLTSSARFAGLRASTADRGWR